MAGFSLPIPASSRTSVPRRSRRPYVFAVGALLCLAAVGTVTVTDNGASILSAAMGDDANVADHAAHVQRREDLVAQMMDKLNGLGISSSAAAAGGIWATTTPTNTPTETEPDEPAPTDEKGNEIDVVMTPEQIMLDNDWTQAELDARLDPTNPLYDPILDSQLHAPPPVKLTATSTTSTATKTSTDTALPAKPTKTTTTTKPAPAKTTSTTAAPKPTATAKPKPSGDNGDD